MNDLVILVPGLFGFGTFGSGPTAVSYFDHVVDTLAGALGWPRSRFVLHEPPPTGSLCWRVKSLYDQVERTFAQQIAGAGGAGRVHLVGHSTGGVDVRLLMNEQYAWPGAPTESARRAFREKVGSVISVAAPQRGTPIGRALRGTMEFSIPAFYLASILAKQGGLDAPQLMAVLTASMQLMRHGGAPLSMPGVAGTMAPETAAQVAAFLTKIVEDRALIHDLTPFAMTRLNGAIAQGECTRLRCYVTVAPRPSLRRRWGQLRLGSPLFAAVYATSYWAAHPKAEERAPFPVGPWLAAHSVRETLETTDACDGVVPSASQTLTGVAAAIIAGDHLDVVGHFDSKSFRGVSVFDSAAGFDDAAFSSLWCRIAEDIGSE